MRMNDRARKSSEKIPVLCKNITLNTDTKGNISIIVKHDGVMDRFVQNIFHRPVNTELELDVFGQFIIQNVDGTKTMNEISQLVHNEFGKDADPLYGRLSLFFHILRTNCIIKLMTRRNYH